jgi:hypothetical protein
MCVAGDGAFTRKANSAAAVFGSELSLLQVLDTCFGDPVLR